MNWYYEKNDEVQYCIQYYNITIISDDNITYDQ